MYFAKRSGRGRHAVFTPAMRTALVEPLQLGEELRSALASDSIGVHCQPIVDLRSGAVVGAEALARWQHPARGFVPPGTFIPLAEELGMVQAIDAQVLQPRVRAGTALARRASSPIEELHQRGIRLAIDCFSAG
ncbi:MAG: EAL domain-containing protein [Candidatus Dormibacteraeota bacterium]|nr:EAL domain-containing protein [Candidatus Dormibacteraeota bacterium]